MAAVLSSCAVGLPCGKNIGAKYSAKAEHAYQSYHSTKLPTEPLRMARSRRLEMRSGRAGSAPVAGIGKTGESKEAIGGRDWGRRELALASE